MSEDNFLQPEDDTTINLINPEETFPGLVGYVKQKFEESETDATHEHVGYKPIRTFAVCMILQQPIVIQNALKYS